MEEEKEELGSVRKTCPHCHGRFRVKPDKTTCPSCGKSLWHGPAQKKPVKEKKVKVKKEKPALIPKPTKEKPLPIVTESKEEKSTPILKPESTDTFYIKSKRGADASAKLITGGGINIQKESVCASDWVTSTPEPVKIKGKELRDEGIIVNDRFSKDYLFSSPSMAAAIVMGRSANGLKEWKNADGKSLKELR